MAGGWNNTGGDQNPDTAEELGERGPYDTISKRGRGCGARGSAAGEEGRRGEERRVPALELDR